MAFLVSFIHTTDASEGLFVVMVPVLTMESYCSYIQRLETKFGLAASFLAEATYLVFRGIDFVFIFLISST